jgi:hypothetical protein
VEADLPRWKCSSLLQQSRQHGLHRPGILAMDVQAVIEDDHGVGAGARRRQGEERGQQAGDVVEHCPLSGPGGAPGGEAAAAVVQTGQIELLAVNAQQPPPAPPPRKRDPKAGHCAVEGFHHLVVTVTSTSTATAVVVPRVSITSGQGGGCGRPRSRSRLRSRSRRRGCAAGLSGVSKQVADEELRQLAAHRVAQQHDVLGQQRRRPPPPPARASQQVSVEQTPRQAVVCPCLSLCLCPSTPPLLLEVCKQK